MKALLVRLSHLSKHLASQRYFPPMGGCAAALLYLLLACFYLEPAAVWSPDEGAKLLQLQSLRIENGSLNMDIIYTSQGIDPEFHYSLINPAKDLLTVQNDALMLPRLPLFTLLTWPFFSLLGFPGLYWLPALGGGAIIWLTLTMIQSTERRLSMWLLMALGSPIFIYAVIFWEHTLAAASSLAGAWLVWVGSEDRSITWRSARWLLAAGLLALGAYLRLEVVLFAVALIAATFISQPKSRSGLLLVAAIFAGFMLFYPFLHQILFEDQALPLNARHLNLPMAYLGQTGWRAVQDLLIGPYTDESLDTGWIGTLWAASAILAILLSWLSLAWSKLRNCMYIALAASLLPAAYFLVTPTPYRAAHGLLFTTPWALLGLARIPELWSQRNPRIQTISLTVLFGLGGYILAMLFFRASSPHGGLEWGARFALLFYPFLALLAGWGQMKTKRHLLLLGLFILLGIGFQLRGLTTIQHDKYTNDALNQAVLSAPEVQVLSDLWWLPLNAAPIYPQKAYFLANEPESLAGWLVQAGKVGFRNILLVTLDPELPDKIAPFLNSFDVTAVETENIENLHLFHLQLTVR